MFAEIFVELFIIVILFIGAYLVKYKKRFSIINIYSNKPYKVDNDKLCNFIGNGILLFAILACVIMLAKFFHFILLYQLVVILMAIIGIYMGITAYLGTKFRIDESNQDKNS